MTQKIGFHISNAMAANSEWVHRYDSAAHLVLAVGAGGEIPELLHVARANPKARIIYRAWSVFGPGDSDHFDWYTRKYGTDPEPFIGRHWDVIKAAAAENHHISYQAFNETGHDEGSWRDFIDFNRRYVLAMDKRGLSASVLGLGPGHPAWDGEGDARERIRRAWFQARPLFEAINNAQQQHIVNLHEYHAFPYTRFTPWVIGRYRWMLEDIQAMGLPTNKIQVVIGESGFTDPNALNYPSPSGRNGYLWSIDQGHSFRELAEDYATMVREIYNDPHLLGLCYFCLGDSGNWEDFSLLNAPELLSHLETLLVHDEEPVITDTPVIKFKVEADRLNIRQSPGLSGAILGQWPNGTIVETNGYTDVDSIRWRRIAGAIYPMAYVAEKAGLIIYLTEYEPEPDWKIEARAQLEVARNALNALATLIEAH